MTTRPTTKAERRIYEEAISALRTIKKNGGKSLPYDAISGYSLLSEFEMIRKACMHMDMYIEAPE